MNTKLLLLPLLVFGVLLAVPMQGVAGEFPTSLLGITLGEPMQQYESVLEMATDARDRDALYLNEVTLDDDKFAGVRGGSLSYGNCASPGSVVGIKVKLDNHSKGLFDDLYDKYEDAFGKPSEYQGDAFKTVISWKWIFRKADQEVQAVLTWSRDPDMRPGTSIKFRQCTMMKAEYKCHQERKQRRGDGGAPKKLSPAQLDSFVPATP